MPRIFAACLCALASTGTLTAQSWPQFGGPQRNFVIEGAGLADTWPASGPTKLWSRALGDGHSSVVVDGNRLFTMYSKGDEEFVVALDRATGKTIWEKGNAAPTAGLLLQVDAFNVRGPHSTPLVAGDLLITVGLLGRMQAFDKSTGALVWSHDLWREFGGTRLERGYVCSPLAYKNLVIVSVGGAGQALMAFDQKTGAVVWRKQTFRLGFSSPILINADGQDQVVMGFADHFVGVEPEQRRPALDAVSPVRRFQRHTAAVGTRTTSSLSRRPTNAAAGRCGCGSRAGRPRSRSSGPTRVCASITARLAGWAISCSDRAGRAARRR